MMFSLGDMTSTRRGRRETHLKIHDKKESSKARLQTPIKYHNRYKLTVEKESGKKAHKSVPQVKKSF